MKYFSFLLILISFLVSCNTDSIQEINSTRDSKQESLIEDESMDDLTLTELDSGLVAIRKLERMLANQPENADEILFSIADFANRMKIEIDEFGAKKEYATISHLRIVKSVNFGDFVRYDGFHYLKVLNEFPDSEKADDAAYHLIDVYPLVFDSADLSRLKGKLEAFIKAYPNSNCKAAAEERVEEYTRLINSGEVIFD